jgi:hypothetical protein
MKISTTFHFLLSFIIAFACSRYDVSAECIDEDRRFTVASLGKKRTCKWAALKKTSKRCAILEVGENCPYTCDSCDDTSSSGYECSDSTSPFQVQSFGYVSCTSGYTHIADVSTMCEYDSFVANCPKLCESDIICEEPATSNPSEVTTEAATEAATEATSCTDSTSTFQVTSVGYVSCTSGYSHLTIQTICGFDSFAANCPRFCGQCCADIPSDDKFEVDSIDLSNPFKKCAWVSNKDKVFRCSLPEVIYHCPEACGLCG